MNLFNIFHENLFLLKMFLVKINSLNFLVAILLGYEDMIREIIIHQITGCKFGHKDTNNGMNIDLITACSIGLNNFKIEPK